MGCRSLQSRKIIGYEHVFFLFCVLLSCTACYSQNGDRWALSADLLIWTVREAGADNWAEKILTEGSVLPNRHNTLRGVHFPFHSGFRVIGYYQKSDCPWDTRLQYTKFNTTGTDSVDGPPGTIHSSFLGNFYVNNPEGLGITGPAYERAKIRWNLDLHIFDWDIGWHLRTSRMVTFRPYIGLKGGWIHQSVHSVWENPNVTENVFYIGKEKIKNCFWGLGVQVGTEVVWSPFWNRCPEFSFFGDFTSAILYGSWSFFDQFTNDIGEQVDVRVEPVHSGAPMMRGCLGCAWSRFQWQLRLSVEMQVWLDHLKYYSFTGGRLGNQLTLQGGTVGLHVFF